MTGTISLSVNDLSCVRDDRTLFKNLTFSIEQSQILLIEGPNGCGKTSLLRILCGMRRQDEGSVAWCEQSIDELGADYREKLAYVGHHNAIKELLTVEENLQVAKAMGQANKTSVMDALTQIGLGDYDDVMSQGLSAGQRRRLALARLLVTDCPLWILDEPFTAIDKTGIAMVEGLIQQHSHEGGMGVMTSHHALTFSSDNIIRVNLG